MPMRRLLTALIGPARDGIYYRPMVVYGVLTGAVFILADNPKTPIRHISQRDHNARLEGPFQPKHVLSGLPPDDYVDLLLNGDAFDRHYHRLNVARGKAPISKTHGFLRGLTDSVVPGAVVTNVYAYPTEATREVPRHERNSSHLRSLFLALQPRLVVALGDMAQHYMAHEFPKLGIDVPQLEVMPFRHPARRVSRIDWAAFCLDVARKSVMG